MTKNFRQIRWLAGLCLLLGLACQDTGPAAPAVRPAEPTVFYLLRHAEQDTAVADDPPLTEQGTARAAYLAQVLAPAGIEAIYATPYRRTQATVAPLADSLGLPVQLYPAGLDLRVLIDSLSRLHAGARICLAGHTTTIPGMANVLVGANRYEALDKGDFETLFIGVKPAQGPAEVLRLALPFRRRE